MHRLQGVQLAPTERARPFLAARGCEVSGKRCEVGPPWFHRGRCGHRRQGERERRQRHGRRGRFQTRRRNLTPHLAANFVRRGQFAERLAFAPWRFARRIIARRRIGQRGLDLLTNDADPLNQRLVGLAQPRQGNRCLFVGLLVALLHEHEQLDPLPVGVMVDVPRERLVLARRVDPLPLPDQLVPAVGEQLVGVLLGLLKLFVLLLGRGGFGGCGAAKSEDGKRAGRRYSIEPRQERRVHLHSPRSRD